MIFRVLLYIFLAYLLYKIIFDFVIPVYKTTRQMRKGFREMHTRMNEYMKSREEKYNMQNKTGKNSSSQKPTEDYIDFEEIK